MRIICIIVPVMHSDARHSRPLAAGHLGVAARRVACRWMQARRAWVTALAVIAMLTFGGSVGALHLAWVDLGAYLTAALLSLLSFVGCLAIGYLGDPFELWRRGGQLALIEAPRAGRSELRAVRPVVRFSGPLRERLPQPGPR